MFTIKRFVCNPLHENTYVVSDDSGEAVIIDCGAFTDKERQKLSDYVRDNGLTPVRLIATHGHVDHHLGDRFAHDRWGLLPEVHRSDADLMAQLPQQAAAIEGLHLTRDDFVPVAHWLDDGETIAFGNHALTVMPAPGHSPGGAFFYCPEEKVLFTGDTLFRGAIGRTDFIGGSMFMIIQTLRSVSQLPDDTRFYPGHGADSTIGYELATNPYLDR